MTKEEIERFEEKIDKKFKSQNFWIKFNTGLFLAFICGLGYCIVQISDIKTNYLSKPEYNEDKKILVKEISSKYGTNIKLANNRTEQLKAVLIEKDYTKYKRLLEEETQLLKEKDDINMTITTAQITRGGE